ncbi:MAG TPA: ABC transporter permease [Vicinamibacterales bacterium]|nr:ABC transporter permease [Vicinamibacterales bacterium]
MAIPVIYNLRSIRQRWTSSIVAVLGIAGAVGVFVAMLAMARGFQATLVQSGSTDNALVMRAGASSEMVSAVTLDQERIIESAPGVARKDGQPVVSPEVIVMAPFPLVSTGTDANVQVRGVSARALEVRPAVHMIAGRFLRSGLNELIVGSNAVKTYRGLELGRTVKFGGGTWTIVGVFDAGGSAFDSEVWADAAILDQVYNRPTNVYQSVTVHLTSPAAFQGFKDALTADPRMNVDVQQEREYYRKQSQSLTTLITVLGTIVGAIMGIGAVFAALNTMYSAVAERSREVATMRAIGFGPMSVIVSFMLEALVIAGIGGQLGGLAVLPLNGFTASTLNFQTFSNIAFAFRVTPGLLTGGLLFALFMGLVGGTPPAIRAARRPVSVALREL